MTDTGTQRALLALTSALFGGLILMDSDKSKTSTLGTMMVAGSLIQLATREETRP